MKSVEFSDTVKSLGASVFTNCESLTNVILCDSLVSIGDNAFYNCTALTSIKFPNSLKSVGTLVFEKSGLWKATAMNNPVYADKWIVGVKGNLSENYIVRDGTVGISDRAFDRYSGFKTVTISNSVMYIGTCAFAGCTMTDITLPSNLISIGGGAFTGCENIKNIVIPDGTTHIGINAFYYCTNLATVTLPNSIVSIGEQAFGHTAIGSNYTGDIVYVGKWVVDVNIQDISGSVAIAESTIGIADKAFSSCQNITDVIVPESVVAIGSDVFENCSNLVTISFLSDKISFGQRVFFNCKKLTSIIFSAKTPPTIFKNTFFNVFSTATVYVPTESVQLYKDTKNWEDCTIVKSTK